MPNPGRLQFRELLVVPLKFGTKRRDPCCIEEASGTDGARLVALVVVYADRGADQLTASLERLPDAVPDIGKVPNGGSELLCGRPTSFLRRKAKREQRAKASPDAGVGSRACRKAAKLVGVECLRAKERRCLCRTLVLECVKGLQDGLPVAP